MLHTRALLLIRITQDRPGLQKGLSWYNTDQLLQLPGTARTAPACSTGCDSEANSEASSPPESRGSGSAALQTKVAVGQDTGSQRLAGRLAA